MNFKEAFDLFNLERLEKFSKRNREGGQREDTIILESNSNNILEISLSDLEDHFYKEVWEFRPEGAVEEGDPSEGPDVANMAFLIWWHDNESKIQVERERVGKT